MRLIDADALVGKAETMHDHFGEGHLVLDTKHIAEAPTIDPVKHGRWVDRGVRDWCCSECNAEIQKVRHVDGYYYKDLPKYCPYCGAKMDGGEDE